MNKERIILECRYLLSLNKSYEELANIFGISIQEIQDDLNIKLEQVDTILYERCQNALKKHHNLKIIGNNIIG